MARIALECLWATHDLDGAGWEDLVSKLACLPAYAESILTFEAHAAAAGSGATRADLTQACIHKEKDAFCSSVLALAEKANHLAKAAVDDAVAASQVPKVTYVHHPCPCPLSRRPPN